LWWVLARRGEPATLHHQFVNTG